MTLGDLYNSIVKYAKNKFVVGALATALAFGSGHYLGKSSGLQEGRNQGFTEFYEKGHVMLPDLACELKKIEKKEDGSWKAFYDRDPNEIACQAMKFTGVRLPAEESEIETICIGGK
jgi:hypothetical protein